MDEDALVRFARGLGASDAAAVAAASITVDDAFASHCTPVACPFYGQSAGCPPHVPGPDAFRAWLRAFQYALLIRIEVPTPLLCANRCEAYFRRLHCIAAAVERQAAATGSTMAKAFAGGSCKPLFCSEAPDCAVIARNAPCRHPECARPSMSGFGVDVARLMAAAGWKFIPVTAATHPAQSSTAPICALVLVE
jgi:predicted metal-binding protein